MVKRRSSQMAYIASSSFRAMVRSGAQEQVLGELLGDGRAALHHGAGRQIADAGAHEADRIDAEMIVEAAVLGGDHRRGR